MRFRHYSPSGAIGARTIPFFLGSLVLVGALAWVYALVCRWIPLIELNLLVGLLFAGLCGVVAEGIIGRGPCRHPVVGALVILLVPLVAVAASHGWNYLSGLSDIQARHPDMSLGQIATAVPFPVWLDQRAKVGWSINRSIGSGTPISGIAVYLFWLAELMAGIAFSAKQAWPVLWRPFCEACRRWISPSTLTLFGLTRKDVESLLKAEDLHGLVRLAPDPERQAQSKMIVLELEHCRGCESTAFLTVKEKQIFPAEKEETKEKTLLRSAVLPPELRTELMGRLVSVAAGAEASPA